MVCYFKLKNKWKNLINKLCCFLPLMKRQLTSSCYSLRKRESGMVQSFSLAINSSLIPQMALQGPSLKVYIHLFQLRLFLSTMFHSLQYTMVNPFVAWSLGLFTFIEIMETICERAFKRAFKSIGCWNS